MGICTAIRNRLFLFLCACFSGILFAFVWRKYEQTVQFSLIHNHYISSLRNTNYDQWLRKKNLSRHLFPEELISYDQNIKLDTESSYLFRNSPVLCLIFANSHVGAEAVKKTWAKHCNVVSYFGRFVDDTIPVIKIPPVTSFEGFCYAFVHIFHKYKELYKWILIADDYTYASVENLRYFVAPLNSSFPYYFGHPVKDFSNLYNVASAGIVLSYGSAALLNSVYNDARDCTSKKPPSWYFDQSLGKILQTFNVHPVDTRDSNLRGRFNPFSVETMLIPGSISVFSSYWRTSAFLVEEGMNCCSDRAITFHGLLPSKMLLMEYILYHMAVFRRSFEGLGNNPPQRVDHTSSEIIDNHIPQVGEAFIEVIDKNHKKSKISKKSENTFVKNIWNGFFGN